MSNGTDDRYRSRKFRIAFGVLISATLMAGWGCRLSVDAQDIAIVIGAWGVVSGAVLKLYNDANIAVGKLNK
jgi:hypothetical protein